MSIQSSPVSGERPLLFYAVLVTVSTVGPLAMNIFVPSIPGLSGFGFYVAGIVLDAAAPNGIGTISNAEHILVR